MTIRTPTANELYAIQRLDEELFAPDHYPLFTLRQYFDVAPEFILGGFADDGALMGYALGSVSASAPVGWLLALTTHPDYLRRGVAKDLLNTLLVRFKDYGAWMARLTVDPRNEAAKGLYQSIGFEEIARLDNYFGANTPRIRMELRL